MKQLFFLFLFVLGLEAAAQTHQQQTYCNPLNLDYTYMIYNTHAGISYRSGADPTVVKFRGEYYMFVTRSLGYWHSTDLMNWQFIHPQKWYFQGSNAPTAFNYKDSLLYVTGDPSGAMSLLYTDNPKKGDWKASPGILYDLQDPALFLDDDDKLYMYWGSSNVYPVRGRELDTKNHFKPDSIITPLIKLDGEKHGWERFGTNHSDTVLKGYMEGAFMHKHNGKYYLLYAAPGTEFNVYGDGVYVGDHPLGPFTYQPHNPVFYKPGGFSNGAGHGSLVEGPMGILWHFGSSMISVNVNWERRLALFPAYFDKDGMMYSNTSFGDYPHYAPAIAGKAGEFTGWMLLSYKKKITGSAAAEGHELSSLVDENIQSFWLSAKNDSTARVTIDLENTAVVRAIQINFHDYKSELYGRVPELMHRYIIEASEDGKNWTTIVDRSESFKDVPNDYVEIETPRPARFIRYRNIYHPTKNLAISEIRVFGEGKGKVPAQVKDLKADRKTDRRDVMITWKKDASAQGYNVKWGIAPNKLYNSWLVYDEASLLLKSLSTDQEYYISVEAFNENGISKPSTVVHLP